LCRHERCKQVSKLFFSSWFNSPPVGLGLLCEVPRSHSDTPHSVGLLWMSGQSNPDTPTWQHTTDIHAIRGIWTHNPSRPAAHSAIIDGIMGLTLTADSAVEWNLQ
jgi:hypothetical protein